jgi:signal transduction histidine kinase
MKGLSLRARITALLLFLSVAPPGAAVWLTRARVRDLVRAGDEARIDAALAEFEAAIRREGEDVREALERVATRAAQDTRARDLPGAWRGSSFAAGYASRLMESAGLDCLTCLDGGGVILSSGHHPASAGRIALDHLRLPESTPDFLEETITPGLGPALTLQTRRSLTIGGVTLHLVGGRLLDSDLLARLSPGGTVRAILLDRNGTILAASQPADPLPVPPGGTTTGETRGELPVRGVPHHFRTLPLRAADGSPIGTLVAAVSLEKFAQLSSSLGRLTLVIVVAGAAVSLILGLALAGGVTRPLRRLGEMSRRVALDRFEPIAPGGAPGEVAELVDSFNRMAEDLRQSRDRLRQTERLAAAEEVARRVAHEIRNPLSPIALTLEGLARTRRDRPGEFDAAFRDAVRTIQEEIQRMRRVLDDFSRFGRLPAPRPCPTDLNALVRQILPLYAENSAAARVEAVLDPELPLLSLDPDLIGQVINNLIGNALQALGSGGGSVTVITRAGPGGATLLVRDTGPGLTEEARHRLFEPYFSTREGGTGLGLAICRRIVLDHGGTIEAGAPGGAGTEIRIALKASGSPRLAAAPAGSQEAAWPRS